MRVQVETGAGQTDMQCLFFPVPAGVCFSGARCANTVVTSRPDIVPASLCLVVTV